MYTVYSYALKQGEMDDDMVSVNLTMLNINAICNMFFFIYIPIIIKCCFWRDSGREQSWRLIERPPEHITASFPEAPEYR
jgi:hypothetical protein